ncbi:Strongly-conserved Zn-finger binding protein (TFIIIA) [Coemansia sp. RSA 2611]|nr:Strongly-conserved Zn-finger binding protein (TFIIIA) [Coemansia sp. RSA 2705]KAJ2321629.1 Strongly-conserved Zn-finger binding protein (TFIIIA) [Coemansia sp. RSA 2704]KAJ2369500.1 Strongly-conserved Zn-finger binding protein (TFIIIA) [Coemansia sp. RSA 2610]KAJ2392633.1 Strongly-conserved Zn-finger binding protein (TFIIIA) [Coemansia sp. RSA 2611]KAJ2739287.1 Strongly-conserved Zn-finger binding protein (TFIIIA) [Coemansia sp. Cherry 401B]
MAAHVEVATRLAELPVPVQPSSPQPPSRASTPRPKPYICDECGKAYPQPAKLEEHQRSHTGDRPFKCQFPGCDKSYMRNGHLAVHAKTHSGEKSYQCAHPGCDKAFNCSSRLKRHAAVHADDKPFKCTFSGCVRQFAKRSQLHVHECSHTGANPHQCTECPQSFKYPSQLRRHLMTHSEELRYRCGHEGCGLAFAKWSQLQTHRAVHKPKSYTCEVCGKKFAKRHALNVHLIRHDPDRPIFACTHGECTKFYIDGNALKAHVRTVHSGRPGFACPHSACDKTYVYKRSLTDHIQRAHQSNQETEHRPRKRLRTRLPTVLEIASGQAYQDPQISGRGRACTVPGCTFQFKRRIELETHLVAVHDIDPGTDDDKDNDGDYTMGEGDEAAE